MRRFLLLATVFSILNFQLSTFNSLRASPVSSSTARSVAVTWMQAMGMRNASELIDVTAETPFTELYLFTAPESGFILVSGDDCAVPVLGYSVENSFPTMDIPQHLLSYLSCLEEEIRWCKKHPADIADTVARQWQLLTNGQMPRAVFDQGVSPMVKARWGQFDYYNYHCPTQNGTSHCAVGCVALAMAEIMHYWRFPETGYGSHSYGHFPNVYSADFGSTTYDWANMPNRLTNLSSLEEIDALSTFLYHVGVSVDMEYGISVSGTYNYLVPSALIRFFKYRPGLFYINRADYTSSEYYALLRAELDQGRPVYVSGKHYDLAGHAFVCDGYSTHNYFHFNVGYETWGNGYYVPDCITMDYQYLPVFINTGAIIGIQPNYNWDSTGVTTITASASGASATVEGTGTYSFGDTVSLFVDDVQDGYRFAHWSDGEIANPRSFIVNGGDLNFTALLEPLTGDTLSYCGNPSGTYFELHLNDYDTCQWGILLPDNLIEDGDTLTAVQIFIATSGTYTLKIYLDSTSPYSSEPIYTSTHYLTGLDNQSEGWITIPLSSPVVVDSDLNLFIAFECNQSDIFYPITCTHYCGNFYGSLNGDNLNYYSAYTWLIRAIFGSHDDTTEPDFCDMPFYLPYYISTDSARFANYIQCWTFLDADGDGYNWTTGICTLSSHSWKNGNVLTPDNWLISPAIELPNIPCVLLWVDHVQRNYPHEHYGIYISTTGTDTSDFTLLTEFTCDTSDGWNSHQLSLDDWSGQTVHIAFRHYNCTDQSYLQLSNIQVLTYSDNYVAAYPIDPSYGSVTGSGSYAYGSSVTVEAFPIEGCIFMGWDNGVTDNPYTFTLTQDTSLIAIFHECIGIDDIEYNGINVYVHDGNLIIEGAEGETVRVYDIMGREIINSQLSIINSQLSSGVYLVKVGNRTAKKVVVIR